MFKKSKNFSDISLICDSSKDFATLCSIFSLLDELNKILASCVPENLISLCRVGAINQQDNLAVIYVTEQEILHLIKVRADHILYTFNNNGYSFNGILLKIKPESEFVHLRPVNTEIKFKNFNPETLEKLTKLANAINRPDLINQNQTINAKPHNAHHIHEELDRIIQHKNSKEYVASSQSDLNKNQSNNETDDQHMNPLKHDFSYFLDK